MITLLGACEDEDRFVPTAGATLTPLGTSGVSGRLDFGRLELANAGDAPGLHCLRASGVALADDLAHDVRIYTATSCQVPSSEATVLDFPGDPFVEGAIDNPVRRARGSTWFWTAPEGEVREEWEELNCGFDYQAPASNAIGKAVVIQARSGGAWEACGLLTALPSTGGAR